MFLSRKLIQYLAPKLKDFTNEQLINAFNAIGIEVEAIEEIPYINNLVFGKIKSFEKIEGSKNLNKCLIQTLDEELHIVCGASNLELNKFVVVAKTGAKFSDDFIITKREIFNHESNGMICGYNEIFHAREKFMADEDKKGVIIIDEEIDLNNSVYDFLNLDDQVFELSIPSNRNDLNGVLALINELNYQLNINFRIQTKKIKKMNSDDINIASCNINDYVISSFENSITKTNWFIKTILINSRINSISNTVDIANFVTLLSANPIHFYDADKINNKLTIIDSTQPYKFTTINNEELELPINSTIAINNNTVSSLVGVIGSQNTMIQKETKNIMVEILNINNDYVNSVSNKLNIKNNTSILFSKPLPSDFVRISFWILYEILKKFGIKLKLIASSFRKKLNFIKIDNKEISNILGIKISNNEIKNALCKSGIKLFWNYAIIPNFRIDLINQQDIAEEILKTFDINKFPEKEIIAPHKIKNHASNIEYNQIYQLKNLLITLGLFEIKTMNLVSSNFIQNFNLKDDKPIEILNPISNNRKYMRISLIPSLFEVLENNLKAKEECFNLFEIQKIYTNNGVKNNLAILITKNILNDIEKGSLLTIADAKLILNKIESYFNIKLTFNQSSYKSFNKNQFNILFNNEVIGVVLEIQNKHLKQTSFAIELDLSKLLLENNSKIGYKQKSPLNPIYRELTFSNPNKNSILDYINDVIRNKDCIEEIKPIAIFRNEQKNTTTIKIKIKQTQVLNNQEIDEIFQFCILKLKDYGLILNDEK